jgi:hypothetical protein
MCSSKLRIKSGSSRFHALHYRLKEVRMSDFQFAAQGLNAGASIRSAFSDPGMIENLN